LLPKDIIDLTQKSKRGFKQFYNKYQDELDELGKRPDLLIFRKGDYDDKWNPDITSLDTESLDTIIPKAIAAFEYW